MKTIALAVAVAIAALCAAYRAIKPKPIPDIPYNKDAAGKLFGDVSEMMGYVMRTKRIFVSLSHSQFIYHTTDPSVLAHVTHHPPSKPHRSGLHQTRRPAMGRGDRPLREPGYSAPTDQGL